MRIRSFIIAYALVLAILLFADRRPGSTPSDHYSHVVDLTNWQNDTTHGTATGPASRRLVVSEVAASGSAALASAVPGMAKTRIIAPAALIPGTWGAGQIPAERLVAPLVVMDAKATAAPVGENPTCLSQISLDDIVAWEAIHGLVPQGAVVAIRRICRALPPSALSANLRTNLSTTALLPLPITRDAAMFLIEARYTIGFAVETPVTLSSDRTLAQQLALHGDYVLEGAAPLTALPATGSLVIVAPAKNKKAGEAPVRVLAMVR